MKTRHIAEVVHNVRAAIAPVENLPYWEEAADAKRKQAVDWTNFYLHNPEATPLDAHASWMGAKLAEGWVLGNERSDEAKTHPHLVLFNELPFANQAIGYAVRTVVVTLRKLGDRYVNVSTPMVVEDLAPVLEQSYQPTPGITIAVDMGAGDSTVIEELQGPSETADVTPLGEELESGDAPDVAVGSELEDSTLSVDPSSNDGMHQ